MKVKSFAGTHRAAVDKQVNDWLTASNVEIAKTDVAFKALRSRGWDAVDGKTGDRRALAIVISVWYNELLQPRSDNWVFGFNRKRLRSISAASTIARKRPHRKYAEKAPSF
jgi:hypothetical protein